MYSTYVLYSPSFDKIYIGYTSDLENRLLSHNVHSKKGYTLRYRPWIVIYKEEFSNKKESIKRERELKSAKGREFIWNIIQTKFK